MTLSTSPVSSGSSALVGHCGCTSNGNSLLLTAGQLAGVCLGLVGKVHFAEQLNGFCLRIFFAAAEHAYLRIHKVFQNAVMGEKIKALENQTENAADLFQLGLARINRAAVGVILGRVLAVVEKLAAVHFGQQRCAAQQRRFAGAGRPDYGHDLAFRYAHANVLEDMQRVVIEAFLNMVHFQYLFHVAYPPSY